MNVQQIATNIGSSRVTVYSIAKSLGITLPTDNEEELKLIRARYLQNRKSNQTVVVEFPLANIKTNRAELARLYAAKHGTDIRSAQRVVDRRLGDEAALWDLYREVTA